MDTFRCSEREAAARILEEELGDSKPSGLMDRISGRRPLIDIGAEISMIPASSRDLRHRKRSQPLTAANGSTIEAYGRRTLSLNIGPRKYTWAFTIVDVHQPKISADFLRVHLLLVDLRGRLLLDNNTYASVPLTASTHAAPASHPSRRPRTNSGIFLLVAPISPLRRSPNLQPTTG
uniref:Peptidase A2 domain-containing protein n=1 Tax=Octopus bimaculoides TaxID=37653 RepID=A0A0L8HCM9_OCTBM